MISRSRRDTLVLAVAMGGTAALAALSKPAPYGGGNGESIDLDQIFPQQFGVWRVDEASRAFVRPALRAGQRYRIYDQVLERTFINDQGQRVMLSVAFGSEQSASLQLHRPEVCYRAGGFEVSGTKAGLLTLAGRALPVTRLVAKMPGRIEPITYWTLLGGEVVSDPRDFRWRRLSFAAQRKLLDGMLVRVSSIDADPAAAFLTHDRFAYDLILALAPGNVGRVIGSDGA
jgi:EpsI family protein